MTTLIEKLEAIKIKGTKYYKQNQDGNLYPKYIHYIRYDKAILAVEQMRDKINKPYDLGNKKVTSKEYAEGYNKAIDDVLNLIGKREKND